MSSKHLVDPELLPMVERARTFDFTRETLPLVRENIRQMKEMMLKAAPPPSEVSVESRYVPGPPGAPEVHVLIHRPARAAKNLPLFLHMHGGGYVLGDAEGSATRNSSLALELQCVVVSVDYRLPPEVPHPAPVEDCYAALKWAHAHAAELGVDASRIAIGGESAGGGLCAALALLTRDRGEVSLIFQLLLYPMLDDRTGVSSDPHPFAGEFSWTAASNRFGWGALLGHEPGGNDVSAYASAARAKDLAGLPSAFIAVGALDLFLEEDIEYARRLLRAGVSTELHIYPGGIHGFDMVASADISQNFQRDYRAALRKAFARKTSRL